jgi:hypothetical protein
MSNLKTHNMKFITINRACISLIWLMSLCGVLGCKKEITTLLQPAEPGAPPVITGFTPDVAWYNHIVEISGNNFSSELSNNTVTIGNIKAEILEARPDGQAVAQMAM